MELNTKTISSIISAGAVLIGSTYYMVNQSQDPNDVQIPIITVPSVNIPTVSYIDKTFGNVSISKYSVSTPNISSPSLLSYYVSPVYLSGVSVDSEKVSLSTVSLSTVSYSVNKPIVQTASVDTSSLTNRLAQIGQFYMRVSQLFSDKKGIERDSTVIFENETVHKWIAVYQSYTNSSVEFKRIYYIPKIIAEFTIPRTQEEFNNINANVDYMKLLGYNSVLFRLNCTEDIGTAERTIQYVKSKNMKVFFTLCNPDTLDTTVFIDPDKIDSYCKVIAPSSDGFILSWRRTSLHLHLMDKPYSNYLMTTVRKYNPDIALFGEIYYGPTTRSQKSTLNVNIPENSTGAIIVNLGYSSVNTEYVMKTLLPSNIPGIQNMQLISVIIGQHPYYNSIHKNNLTDYQNYEIKKIVEDLYISYGCIGTLTMSSDGSADNDTSIYTNNDNLTKNLFLLGK